MIYTCYEMIQDCRAGKPEGWSYFVKQYGPVAGRIAAHYGAADADRILPQLRPLLASLEPMPERHFVAELRQAMLAALFADEPLPIDLEKVQQGWAPLTVVEKKAAWLETMGYGKEDTGRILRVDPNTVEKIRAKAAEALGAIRDGSGRGMPAANGRGLGRAAARQATEQCVPTKALLDMIDGRTTWYKREELERHITGCLHCIDHFCRMHEVCDLLRQEAGDRRQESESSSRGS